MKGKCAGYIEFTFCDVQRNEYITLGGAGWPNPDEVKGEWEEVPTFKGSTAFSADLLSSDCIDRLAEKPVSAGFIEQKLGLPIALLIELGRKGMLVGADAQESFH